MRKITSKRLDDLVTTVRAHLDEAIVDHLYEALEQYGPSLDEAGQSYVTRCQRVDSARHFIEWLEGKYPKSRPLVAVDMNKIMVNRDGATVRPDAVAILP